MAAYSATLVLSQQVLVLSQHADVLSQQVLVQADSVATASSAAFSPFLEQQFPQDTAATITDATARDINTFFIVNSLKLV